MRRIRNVRLDVSNNGYKLFAIYGKYVPVSNKYKI